MKSFAILYLVAAVLAAPAQEASKFPGSVSAAANSTTAAGSCSQTQTQLQQGIQKNLDIQAKELIGVQSLQKMSQAGTAQATTFQAMQISVLDIQQKGVNIRANNQKLAQQINSPASAGLATVAMAQTLEISQVLKLNGNATDATTLQMLVTEVQGGTQQNQKNLAAAKSQNCAN
ncbi:hypothetical protein C7974DRAFT_384264 [Boeremia exigua]|uniref:uncharacterized protein n=1 Tax=Boeremia exigua TaxID=749465 RepID=UPI001E8CE121|nr:uncharacterized protein C7974DRAFT_384264 [Boeremia exigua]KAH6644779.1 hypothetical protein C7974DRAFT_384264 [Boeremia exigua]